MQPQELHRRGHEISAHSISHQNEEQYWGNGTEEVRLCIT